MKLTFYGAARQVTGSMYLLQTNDGYNILIDCGYDMEKDHKKSDTEDVDLELEQKPHYGTFPFEPSQIHVVILTHAHIDHTGRLPLLYKEGYEGQILCTTPTYYLTHILLEDSAMLNQKKLKRLLDKHKNKRMLPEAVSELYFGKQVEDTMDMFVSIPLNQKFKLNDEVSVSFHTAGHLLGAAHLVFKIKEDGKEKSICFSGDIGRKNYPLLPDPQRVPEVDYLVCESTYGARLHRTNINPEHELEKLIENSLVKKQGKLIFPAFSVGRTQALLYTLSKLYRNTELRKFKIYSDSPMAQKSSKVYEQFIKQLNKEAREYFEDNDELFDFDQFEYIQDLKQSKALTNHYEPCIIISSSGMISGGRIEHHVRESLENPKATIGIIGYCAEGTIGYELMNGAKEITIRNQKLEVRCDIEVLDCFSAHGDQSDLINFVEYQSPEKVKQIFLTHGDEYGMHTFAHHLTQKGYKTTIPYKGETFIL
ncbi:MAG: MBL fold metallo-hydrolase [Bacteroidota bacterium]|nr:MBL fold metallo-hydrolase [Bacteroidota bacterium]